MSGPKTPDNVSADNTSDNATQPKGVEPHEEGSAGGAVSGSGVPEKVARRMPSRNTPKRSSAAFSAPPSSRKPQQAVPTPSTAESSMDSRIPAGVQNSFLLSQEKNKDKLHRSPQENEERLRKLLGLSTGSSAATTQEDSDNQEGSDTGVLSQGQRRVHDVDGIAGQADGVDSEESDPGETETADQPEEEQAVEDEDAEDEAETGSDDEEDNQDLEPITELIEYEQQPVVREVQRPRRDWSNYTTTGSHSRVESFVQGFHSLIGIERRKVIQRLGLVTEEDLLETEGLLEEASAELEKYSGYEDLSVEVAEYKELAEDNAAAYDTVQEQLTMLMDHCEEREAYIQQLRGELSQTREDLSTANDLLGSVNGALVSIDTQKYPNIVLNKDYSGLAKVVADAEHAGESVTDTENDNTASPEDNESDIEPDDAETDEATDSAEENGPPLIQVPDLPPTTQEDIAQTPEDYSDTLDSVE